MAYYIAIDGGGTKTEAVLCTGDGGIICRTLAGSTNPNDVGAAESGARLRRAADTLRAALPVGERVTALFAGVSGATGNIHALESALAGAADKVTVGNDALCLLATAGRGDAVCLIAGTGSVCFVRCGGVLHRIGGWGYLIDGGGGGYDIGRDALSAVLCAHAGRGDATSLTEAVEKKLGAAAWDAIPMIYRGGKRLIASLAPLVFAAAAGGDAVSCGIIARNAEHLAGLVRAADGILRRDDPDAVCRGVLGGGLFADGGIYPALAERVPRGVELIRADVPPVYGAFCEATGDEPSPDVRGRFMADYAAAAAENNG